MRKRQRPIRFQGSTFDSDSSAGNMTHTESDTYFKIKRVLARRNRNGRTEYLVQFSGEPAQNALWIPYEQLNPHTQQFVRSNPTPVID